MSTQPDFDRIKQNMRATWSAGDFGQIAVFAEAEAEDFVNRLGIEPGATVLDVACGTGNLAIPSARAGAQVTGLDIAPNLLEQARKRATSENLSIAFEEGDAEQLPYPDASFDLVITMFGAMFAPRPERVAAELTRVCRPGGTIAMANWTREGLIGKVFAMGSRYVPAPAGLPAPVEWGNEQTARERLQAGASRITTTRRIIEFNYPFPPAEVVQFFCRYFGPTIMAFARLDEQQQSAYVQELKDLYRKHNEATGHETGHGRTLLRAEYLEVLATRKES